jgi:hypothetical protein
MFLIFYFKLETFCIFFSFDLNLYFYEKLISFYKNVGYWQFKDYYYFRYYRRSYDDFLHNIEYENMWYLWHEMDIFGDSEYSDLVRERLQTSIGVPTGKNWWIKGITWKGLHLLGKKDPTRFFLWDFTYVKADPHLEKFKLFNSIEHIETSEKNFAVKYDKYDQPKPFFAKQDFRDFVTKLYRNNHFKLKNVAINNFTYAQLADGITEAITYPYLLPVLYKKQIWDFLVNYYAFRFDFFIDVWLIRKSVMYFLAFDKLDFFGLILLDGVRGATFNSNLFSLFYEAAWDPDDPDEIYDDIEEICNLLFLHFNLLFLFSSLFLFLFFFKILILAFFF